MTQTRIKAKQATYKSDATGAAVRTLHDKLGDTVSVKDFGAVGDGVTDDTAAFNAAATTSDVVIVPQPSTSYVVSGASVGTTTFVFLGDIASSLSGTDVATDLNAVGMYNGTLLGAAYSPELRDKGIEIVAGTLRQEQPQSVTSITRSGTSGIVTQVGHGYSVGDYVVIRGAVDTRYNGTHQIAQVDSADVYRVLVDSSLATPATGTITAFQADKWEWIKDSTHEPIGVNDSSPCYADGSGYGLLIPFSKTYSKVLSFVCGPDETIAGAQGMVIGASVSTNAAALRASLNKTIAGRIYWNGSAWAKSMGTDQGDVYTNNAVYPLNNISYSGGNLTITHSFCPGVDVRVMPHSGGGAVVPYLPVIKSVTDSTTVINFNYVNAGALDLYTGAESTSLSLHFTKNTNRLIKFDGSDRSSENSMFYGNIWFFGIMQV